MKRMNINGVVLWIMIGALPLVVIAPVSAQGNKQTQEERNKIAEEKAAQQKKSQQEKKAQHQQEAEQKAKEQQGQAKHREAARQQEAQEQKRQEDARAAEALQQAQQRAEAREQEAQRRQAAHPGHGGRAERLPEARQEELIAQQRNRGTRYREDLVRRERAGQERAQSLRQGSRMAQYRFQEDYLLRLRQQRAALESRRSYDYRSDPYFYTPPSLRYSRQGTYYETNQYGADVLRRAVDYGYEEGLRTGEADHQDNWGNGYEDSFAYRDANYGYGGEYVDQGEYNYYFREGFRRGYEDGVNSRYRYGRQANGRYELIASVLAQILSFQSLN